MIVLVRKVCIAQDGVRKRGQRVSKALARGEGSGSMAVRSGQRMTRVCYVLSLHCINCSPLRYFHSF